jgi:hypothetical protein
MSTLQAIIHENVREGELFEKLDGNWVRCFACGRCCKIPEGQPGVCKVRYNRGRTLLVIRAANNELTRLVEFLASVSSDIPWHVTAFHKDYKVTDPENTRPETLMRAQRSERAQACVTSMPGTCRAWSATGRTRLPELSGTYHRTLRLSNYTLLP